MLNVEELFELEENIKEELDDHLTNIRGSKLYVKQTDSKTSKGALIVSHGDGCMSVLFAFVVTQQILSNRKRVPFSTAYQSAYLHTTPDQVGLKLHHNFPTTRRE